jgi:hypothetical protein
MIRSRSSRTCSSAEGLVRLLALTLLAAALPRPAAAAADPSDRLLLARPFPIEAAPSFPGALFHWIDSLAGTSNGKTIPVHQQEYVELFGPMTDADKAQLDAFVAARAEHLQRLQAAAARGGPPAKFSALLGTFCSSATVEEALDRAKDELSPGSWNGLAGALAYFRIWHDGEIPKAFLARARSDPSVSRLESLLARIVRFYQVDPLRAPPPRLALVPVRPGGGTHAEAIGGVLLLEIRAGDTLSDEASVIVHETSHFLWNLVDPERQRRLGDWAVTFDTTPPRLAALLGEAIPTALGQGVADHMFRPDAWSTGRPWYHTRDVDLLAKRMYPVVASALDHGKTLDESFLRAVLRPEEPLPPPVVRP